MVQDEYAKVNRRTARKNLWFVSASRAVVSRLLNLVTPTWKSKGTVQLAGKTFELDITVQIQVLAQRQGIGAARCGKRRKQSVRSQRRKNVNSMEMS
tara:strand:- start:13821 stop:14111 length:291 start_codon:yes stop_codon:yes gene_type:complete